MKSLFTLALLVAVSVLQTACLWDYDNYIERKIVFSNCLSYNDASRERFFNEDVSNMQLYLPIRKKIGHPDFDKSTEFAKSPSLSFENFNFFYIKSKNFDSTIASEHMLCKLDEVDLKQMKKELSNVGEFDSYYFREDSSLKNLSTGERLSICSNVDIVYQNKNGKNEILKTNIIASYYLKKNENNLTEISKQKYIEIKKQWGIN
ncbi:MAG: hypothetical protein E7035_02695 [Verrucomicrobiaceae bacterium]|nr:hypothetical protein [Verrucomicrobiaceae bacterium]